MNNHKLSNFIKDLQKRTADLSLMAEDGTTIKKQNILLV